MVAICPVRLGKRLIMVLLIRLDGCIPCFFMMQSFQQGVDIEKIAAVRWVKASSCRLAKMTDYRCRLSIRFVSEDMQRKAGGSCAEKRMTQGAVFDVFVRITLVFGKIFGRSRKESFWVLVRKRPDWRRWKVRFVGLDNLYCPAQSTSSENKSGCVFLCFERNKKITLQRRVIKIRW